MELASLHRATVDIDGFPCKQLFMHDNGAMFWDLDYLHIAFVEHGANMPKYSWFSQFREGEVAFMEWQRP